MTETLQTHDEKMRYCTQEVINSVSWQEHLESDEQEGTRMAVCTDAT